VIGGGSAAAFGVVFATLCEAAKLTRCAVCGSGHGAWCLVTGAAPPTIQAGAPCPRGCTHEWPSKKPMSLTANVDSELSCPVCWECFGITGPSGIHLARFAQARASGLITAAEFASVIADADVFSGATVVRTVPVSESSRAQFAAMLRAVADPVDRDVMVRASAPTTRDQ
jgi:hypothetical protein